jgi:hypothetical protein
MNRTAFSKKNDLLFFEHYFKLLGFIGANNFYKVHTRNLVAKINVIDIFRFYRNIY